MKKVILSLIATMLILSACSKGEPAEEKSESRSKQQQDKAFSVMVEKVAPRNLEEYINFTGKLEGITDITLSSQIHGEVVKIYKKLGDWVKKGESIGSIDNAGHKNQLDQAKAFLLAAEATFEVAEMQIRASKSRIFLKPNMCRQPVPSNLPKQDWMEQRLTWKTHSKILITLNSQLRFRVILPI
jgi:multidrug efflux pump subunit AcrA (membrane-fusion protein)